MNSLTQNTKLEYITPDGSFEFPYAPIGSEEVKQEIKRSDSGGLMLNVFQNFRFVKGARSFIISEFYKQGAGGSLQLKRREKYYNDFELLHSAYLSFPTLEWDKTSANCDFVENGFDTVFRDNVNEKFEMDRTTDINGNDISALVRKKYIHRARKIFLRSVFNISEAYTLDTFVSDVIVTPKLNVDITSDEDNSFVLDDYVVDKVSFTDVSVSNMFHLDATRDKTLSLTFDIDITVSTYVTVRLVVYRFENGTALDYVDSTQIETTFSTDGDPITFQGTEVIEVLEGQSLMFGVSIDSGVYDVTVTKADITQEEDSLFNPLDPEEKNIDCVPVKYAFERITEILDPTVEFRSSFLDDNWPDLIITSGETIRHVIYTDEDTGARTLAPLLTTSFKELYDAVYAIEPCQYTIITEKGKTILLLEAIDYAYDGSEVGIDLGQLSEVKRKVDQKKTYGGIKIGYSKTGDNEEVNGLQAAHTVNEFNLPCNTTDNIYAAVSPFITAPDWFELIFRKQFSRYPDVNHKNDKDIFLVDAEKNTILDVDFYVSHEWQEHFSAITGVYDKDSATNYRLLPMNCIYRHAKNFMQEYTKPIYSGSEMLYKNTERNVNVTTTLIGGTARSENDDVLISLLDDPLTTNIIIEGVTKTTKALRDKINGGIDKPNYLKSVKIVNEIGGNEYGFINNMEIEDEITVELVEQYR